MLNHVQLAEQLTDKESEYEQSQQPHKGNEGGIKPESDIRLVWTRKHQLNESVAIVKNHYQVIEAEQARVRDEDQEKLHVHQSDAVCQPLAVVVKS